MAASAEFRDYILELCEPFAQISAKSMFGGYGLYLGGGVFAILAGDTLFLKADDETRQDFVDAGLAVFTYNAKGKPRSLSFYAAPEQALKESGQLEFWVCKAVAAGGRAAKGKAAKNRPDKVTTDPLTTARTETATARAWTSIRWWWPASTPACRWKTPSGKL